MIPKRKSYLICESQVALRPLTGFVNSLRWRWRVNVNARSGDIAKTTQHARLRFGSFNSARSLSPARTRTVGVCRAFR